MNSEYKEKYLKYKKKYLELKSNLKGGAFVKRCNRQINSTFIDVSAFYSISDLKKYFTNPTLYPVVVPPDYYINFTTDPIDISTTQSINSISFYHYSKNLPIAPLIKTIPKSLSAENIEPNPEPLILNLEITPPENTYSISFDKNGIDSQIKVKPNVFSDLTSSIIGKNFNLVCDETIVENFLIDITTNSHKKIVVIDFQNIIKIIEDDELFIKDRKVSCGTDYIKKIFSKKINNMLHTYLVNGDYVFLIFKKSYDYDDKFLEQILTGPYDLKNLLNDSSSLQIIYIELGTIFRAGELTDDIDNTGEIFDKDYLGIYKEPITSSNDDLVFWMVLVSIYNIINSRIKNNVGMASFNFLTNLIIFTNDTQGLDDNCNDYYRDITNIFKPVDCRRSGSNNIPEKNLFDINLGVYLPFVTNGYKIYTSSPRFTNTATIIGDMPVSANNFYYVNNYLLNEYINFIHNLFGNTPIKLNNNPNYLISDSKTKNYVFNASKDPPNRFYQISAQFIDRKETNAKAFYALTRIFQTENICLSSLRTDTVNFIINKLPIRNIGYTETTLISLADNQIDFENLMMHPGLFFYAQIKNIQKKVFGSSNGSKSKEDIIKMSDEFNNFNIRYDILYAYSQMLKTQKEGCDTELTKIKDQVTRLTQEKEQISLQLSQITPELNELKELKEKNIISNTLADELQEELQYIVKEHEKLQVQLKNLQAQRDELQVQLENITRENDILRNARDGLLGKRGRIDDKDRE